jgi:3-hydroxyacyl-CoA dehydrogenase/enoyl-CoA hydratase/3-hydroxybutyryl-CoA epimerase
MKRPTRHAVYREIEQIKKNFRTLETLGKPVVSCLNGTALGGGWEVALVGHHRIAVDDPKIQFGLPEVTLGLIPGAGGITKMTRLLGLMGAQPYMLESRLFGPRRGAEAGPGARAGGQRCRAAARRALAWIAVRHPVSAQPWDDKPTRSPAALPSNPKPSRRAWSWRRPCSRRPRAACTPPRSRVGGHGRRCAGRLRHRDAHREPLPGRLMVSPVAKNMINTFFFNLNAIKSGQSRPKDVPRYKPARRSASWAPA